MSNPGIKANFTADGFWVFFAIWFSFFVLLATKSPAVKSPYAKSVTF
jgi:hypothetical protein